MALRPILQIEVQDQAFRDFQKRFNDYQAALKKMPKAWEQVEKGIDGSRESFDQLVGRLAAARLESERRERAEEHLNNLTRSSAERWQSMARSTRDFARNISDATVSLLRWASVTGVISGLVGAGGLFGIDRLALGAAAQRRTALGIGATIGEQQAFGANFSRLVDPDSFLGGVSRARLDVQQRTGLVAAGLTQQEINGTAGQTAVALLRNLSKLAEKWDPRLFAQFISAYRLDGIVSPEDLQRLRNTPAAERERLFSQYGADAARFRLPDNVARDWQDFTTQLSRAGQGIEQTFIKGLVPLGPGLTKLSAAVEELVHTFLDSKTLKEWIQDAGEGLKSFAAFVGTDEFKHDVQDFVIGVGNLAKATVGALRFFGLVPGGVKTTGAIEQSDEYLRAFALGGGTSTNNPGNLRPPGASSGFASFATPEAGLRAMADQILRYERRDKLDTLEKIIAKYAPPSENDTEAYIGDVSRRTGIGRGQRLDASDTDQLARIVAAMIAHEQRAGKFEKYKDAKVVVEVLNKTGDNVNLSVNGLKQ